MSKNILHKNRNGCALHGALKVVNAVDGLVPIIHSSAGCSIHSELSNSFLTGNNGNFYSGWSEIPTTSVIEKQVVFGGSSRLREQIKNTVKVQAADLYVVLSGCAPEIVGDDAFAMVKEAQEQGFPVITVITPGFKGNVYKGYELAVKSIIDSFSYQDAGRDIQKNLVNILGILPEQDIFWEGTLNSLNSLFSSLGLQSNTLFGYGQSSENWKSIPFAELNIVFSPWGLSAAEQLKKRFNTPYLYLGYIPVGAADTAAFIDQLKVNLPIAEDRAESVKKNGEQYQYYQFQKLAHHYVAHNFQKEIALVGDSYSVIGLARFLHNSFGQLIKAVIITDNPNEELRQQINELLPVNEFYPAQVIYTLDGSEIDEHLLNLKPEFIFGSSLEQSVADKLSVPLVKISSPVFDQTILNHSYSLFTGSILLIQDFANALIKNALPDKLNTESII